MGQQQLLLLVLATVIVGIATVVGIQAFDQNSAKANADAMLNDAVRIASDIQAWGKKAEPFGGPGDGETFADATFAQIGYGTGLTYTNTNGTYTIAASAPGVTITGDGANEEGNQIVVSVCGLGEADVEGAITNLNGNGGDDAPACAE
ncbi:MAG: hypothetical protein R6T83_07620 [Salinibacter sp.]